MNSPNKVTDLVSRDSALMTASAVIQSNHASKYLTVLCRHFSRKVEAEWDDDQGIITFSIGVTSMQVNKTGDELSIVCQSENEALLEDLKSVIDRHVDLFSRRESIELVWKDKNLS